MMTSHSPVCACPELRPDAYAKWRASEIGAITERLERRLIFALAGDVGGRTVLDVGCGDGEFALGLVKRSAIVTGIDASPAMIDAAKRRAREHGANIVFQVAMAQQLPFPAEQFDIVTAITILCFVEDATPVFREIARCCGPGAALLSANSGNGVRGRRGDAFVRGSAPRSGAKDGSGRPVNFAISPAKPASASNACGERSTIPAGLQPRAG